MMSSRSPINLGVLHRESGSIASKVRAHPQLQEKGSCEIPDTNGFQQRDSG